MSTEFSTDLVPYGSPTQSVSRPQVALNPLRMLRMRALLMTVVFLVVSVPALVAVWTLTPQMYTASDHLQFRASEQRILYRGVPGDAYAADYDKYVGNYAAMVKQRPFLARVVVDPKVSRLEVLRPLAPEDRLQFLQDALAVRRIPGTEYLQVSATLTDPQAARAIVDVAVARMEVEALAEERQAKDRVNNTLEQEEEALSRRHGELLEDIARLQHEMDAHYLDMPGFGGGASLQVALAQADQGLNEARAGASAARKRLDTLKGIAEKLQGSPGTVFYEYDIERRAASDPRVSSLRNQEIALETRIQTSPYVPGHEALRQLEAQLEQVRSSATKALQTARRETVRAMIGEAELALQAAEDTAAARAETVNKLAQELQDEQGVAGKRVLDKSRIQNVENEKDRVFDQLLAIREKLRQARVEEAGVYDPDRPRARVSRPSNGEHIAVRPDDSKRNKMALMALIGAAGLAFAVGFLREITDQQLHSSEDLSYITPLPILAAIPHTSTDQLTKAASAAMLARDHPNSPGAEEFRRILARIIYPPEGAVELKTILVTSPSRGDGKTSLVCNLGIALAEANRRVLLVDINTRRPGVEKSFAMDPEPGLGEILAGECAPEDAIRPTEFPNLFVLGPGFLGRDVSGKLASRDAVEFFEEAEHAFDHVVIDTPPCLLVSDAKLLAPLMDGVLLVVGVGSSTSGMTRRCLLDMQQCGAHVIGMVLNGVRATRGGYLRRNREAYYAYSGENGHGSSHGSHNGNGRSGPRADAAQGQEEDLPMILLVDDREGGEDTRET